MKKTELKGKYVIGFDTICEGNQTSKDENDLPVLYDSYEEAFKELFSDAIEGIRGYGEDYFAEMDIDLDYHTSINRMEEILKMDDVKLMEKTLDEEQALNYNDDFVEKADEFILGRKAIFTGTGITIEGTKLEEI